MPHLSQARKDAETIFNAAVAAVLPANFLPAHLPPPPAAGRLLIVAAGKAGATMAAAAEAHYLDGGFPAARMDGLAIVRHGYAAPTRIVPVLGAGHPVPDEAGVAATRRLLAFADSCGADDQVVVLMSGGASANLCAPAEGITLAEKQELTRQLLRAGVPIDQINTVRRHISAVKGGRLAARFAPAAVTTIALSDVPDDDIAAIGSGPTVPDATTLADGRAVLARFGITPPASIGRELENPANETPKPGDPCFARATAMVGATPESAYVAAWRKAQSLGYAVVDLGATLEGEAREVAGAHAQEARRHLAEIKAGKGKKVALLSGGELTVTIAGTGRGGPNQEYALALAIALGGEPGIVALAADTDGTDGGAGAATDPAGAFVDPETLARAASRGVSAQERLLDNDSTAFFAAVDGLFVPGPTLTNANDLRIILIDS